MSTQGLMLLQYMMIAAGLLFMFTLQRRARARALRNCGLLQKSTDSNSERPLTDIFREMVTVQLPEDDVRTLPTSDRIYIAYSGPLAIIRAVLYLFALRTLVIAYGLVPANAEWADVVRLVESHGIPAFGYAGAGIILWVARRWIAFLMLPISLGLLAGIAYLILSMHSGTDSGSAVHEAWQSDCGCTNNRIINTIEGGLFIAMGISVLFGAANLVPLVPLSASYAWGTVVERLFGRSAEWVFYLITQVILTLGLTAFVAFTVYKLLT